MPRLDPLQFHPEIHVERTLERVDADLRKIINDEDGNPMDPHGARIHLESLRDQGFTFMPHPDCNNHDATGRCLGHKTKKGGL